MIYLRLFLEFLKIGTFSVGGGLATLPFLAELVEKYSWITQNDLVDIIAIAESTPGPIGVNAATYMGFKTAGVFGGIAATAGLVFPALIIIAFVAHYFMKFNENKLVRSAFYGLRPAVTGMIAAAGFQVATISLVNMGITFDAANITGFITGFFNFKEIILFAVVFFLLNKYNKHPSVSLRSAAAGITSGSDFLNFPVN